MKPNEKKVLILLLEKKNKLRIAWKGPFTIETQISLVDYLVNINEKKKIFHGNMLKKYYERPAQPEKLFASVSDEPLNSGNTAVISIPDD